MPSNKRVIPRGEKFMNDKKVCDLTYTKLQIESNWKQGENHRYIYKEKINLSEWSRELGVSRQTLKTRLNYLKSAGLIREDKDVYILEPIGEHLIYIPEDTLRILTNAMKKDTIKIYAYLGGWFKYKQRNRQAHYTFTRYNLIAEIGLVRGNTTLQKVNDILLVLNKLGLIKTEERQVILNGSRTTQLVLLDWKEAL